MQNIVRYEHRNAPSPSARGGGWIGAGGLEEMQLAVYRRSRAEDAGLHWAEADRARRRLVLASVPACEATVTRRTLVRPAVAVEKAQVSWWAWARLGIRRIR